MSRQRRCKFLSGADQERRMGEKQCRHRRWVNARMQVHWDVKIYDSLPKGIVLRLVVEQEGL